MAEDTSGSEDQRKESVAKVTRIHAPGADIDRIANALCNWYVEEKEMQAQVLEGPGQVTVQARTPGWRTLVGMSMATTVVLRRDGDQLAIEIGGAKWGDKGVIGVGALFVPLLWIPAGIGVLMQGALPRETVKFIRSQIREEAEALPVSIPQPAPDVPKPEPARRPQVKVDLNTADAGEIVALPGMDRVTADKVVRERERIGGFTTMEAAAAVMAPHVFARAEESIELSAVTTRPQPRRGRKIGKIES